jgi:hypothetical protein
MSWMLDKEIKREMPQEWNGIIPTEVFMQEAEKTVEEANKKGITLRVLGGLGIAIHCKNFRDFAVKLGRVGTGTSGDQEYSDIDLVSYREQREKVKAFFADNGYENGKQRFHQPPLKDKYTITQRDGSKLTFSSISCLWQTIQ